MAKSQGFSQKQLKQLKILFTGQRRYTDKEFIEQQAYTDKKFGETQHQIKKLTKLIKETRKDLVDRITNLAVTTPTRKEFEEFKVKVNYYHPTV